MSPAQDAALTAASIIMLAVAVLARDELPSLARRLMLLLGVAAALGLAILVHGWASGLARGPVLIGLGGMLAVVSATWCPEGRRTRLRGIGLVVAAVLVLVGWP